ncbi:MAG: hypothetical protein C0501_30245 [Isosphaera sp.]|nr:hypothetical protein [Isosphaera sp.]
MRTVRAAAILATVSAAGCVDRRFVIESNVPNAQVYLDDRPIGAAPAHTPFEYYGDYTVTLVLPGYETLTRKVHVPAPWYSYPPFDFIAEVVYPFHIRDTRRFYFELYPATRTRVDDLLNAADALQLRGRSLPAPERPAAPRPGPQSPAPPPVPVGPDGEPQPPPGLVPGVGPGT